MSRITKSKSRATGSQATSFGTSPHARRLHFETLESRRLLATFPVNNLLDGVVTASGDLPGSLRQALFDANAAGGADSITFDPSLFSSPQAISLQFGELEITEAVTLSVPVPDRLVIDAQSNSRIFNFTATAGDFSIEGLTLTNGKTTADNGLFDSFQSGGAIRSLTSGLLTLTDSVVSGSSTRGKFADGGAIYAKGDVLLEGTTVSNNRTSAGSSSNGDFAQGGGIFTQGALTLTDSSLIANHTYGSEGSFGGGAAAFGDVTLTRSIVENNSTRSFDADGGGLFTTQSVALVDSIVRDNSTNGNRSAGGGVFALGDVSIQRSAITGNSTSGTGFTVYENEGGGIRAAGDITVVSSTISGNSTVGNASHGGGLFALGHVTLSNSTVSGNSASSSDFAYENTATHGGGLFAIGSVVVNNSTVYNNSTDYNGVGGGIFTDSSLTLANSIVAGNSDNGAGNPDIRTRDGQVDSTYSLVGKSQGTFLVPVDPGDNALNTTAELAPLADNGGYTLPDGSVIQTHSLIFGSPAIDTGDPNFVLPPSEDQRGVGFDRVVGGRIDMGAYERNAPPPPLFVVDTLDDTVNTSDEVTSLREALSLSNPPANADDPLFIEFDSSLTGGTILLDLGELIIDKRVILTGFAGDPITIDALLQSRAIHIEETAGAVTLQGLNIVRGSASGNGGGIWSESNQTLFLEDSSISSSSATSAGGAISAAGDVRIVRTAVTGNQSDAWAGGIRASGDVHLTDSAVNGNTASSGVGGILASEVTMIGSMVNGNIASGNNASGGGISADSVTLTNSTVSGNSTSGNYADGGGISADSVTLTNSTVSGNSTSGNYADGGGIRASSVTLTNSTVSGNSTSGNYADGGGIRAESSVTLTNSTVSGNSTSGNRSDGGGISSSSFFGTVLVINSTVSDNRALGEEANGGGIYVSFANLSLRSSTVSGNRINGTNGNGAGAGIHSRYSSSITIEHSTLADNHSYNGTSGGGLYIRSSNTNVNIEHSIVSGNTASNRASDLDRKNPAIGQDILASYSLVGAYSGTGIAGPGNVLGSGDEIGIALVEIEIAAMGNFEDASGTFEDSYIFEYSTDSTTWNPLFTSSVDVDDSQTYTLASGVQVNLDDPISVNGVKLDNKFQTFVAAIPNPGPTLQIRFTATTDGGSEAFAWRNLVIRDQATATVLGRAVSADPAADDFGSFDQSVFDYFIEGDMFGIRSRGNPGSPALPLAIADDTLFLSPADTQGIVDENDSKRFFGVVDTVNGQVEDTNTASWTFSLPAGGALDPVLGPLANNGGSTPTHSLLPGSPVIDAGDPALSGANEFDQRGAPFVRVANGRIDIGAVEQQTLNASHFVVTTTADELDYSNADVSLREAINSANGSLGKETITFESALSGQTILLDGKELAISGEVTIDATALAQKVVIDAQNRSRVLFIAAGSGDATLKALSLTHGRAASDTVSIYKDGLSEFGGGAVRSLTSGDLTITNSSITGSYSSYNGGGVYSSANLILQWSTISGNHGDRAGGLISADATITQSVIDNNTSYYGGGGIRVGNVTLRDSSITNNRSESRPYGFGGGISAGNATITNSTISGNYAAAEGGGILATSLVLTNSTVSGNTAYYDAAGIRVGNATISSSTITNNQATGSYSTGGGVFQNNRNYQLSISNSIIAGNTAVVSGQDIVASGGAFQSMNYSVIGIADGLALAGIGNLTGTAASPLVPLLGPLTNNGGPTQTHTLLPGSPAINAGDPSILFSPTEFDQRGDPFARVSGGRIDIGAFEVPGGNNDTGVEILVIDFNTDQQYAYDGDGNLVDSSSLTVGNNSPRGIATAPDGSMLWVVDTDRNVYLYDGDGNSQGQWSFTGFANAEGIATDGADIWIVSTGSDAVHRFIGGANFTGGSHAPDFSFNLAGDNVDPFGITTDGNRLWVVNDLSNQWKTFVYDTAGALLGSWDLDPGNKNARGITLDPADPTDILVVNAGNPRQIYRYDNSVNVISGSLMASGTTLLDAANSSPHGLSGRVIGSSSQAIVNADFDTDGDVDGNDFLIWQRGFSTSVPDGTQSVGDADGDRDVDGGDLVIWEEQFNAGTTSAVISQTMSIVLPAELFAATQESLPPSLVDAAIALDLFQQGAGRSSSRTSEISRTSATMFEAHTEPVQFSLLPAVDQLFSVLGDDDSVFDIKESDFHEEKPVNAHLFNVAKRILL